MASPEKSKSDLTVVEEYFLPRASTPGPSLVMEIDGEDERRRAARTFLSELLVRVGRQDRDAFNKVYELTKDKLFGICLRLCRDHAAAEDVLVDVYFAVWTSSCHWSPGRSSPITWLATIARNRSIDWLRRQRHLTSMPIEFATEIPDRAPDSIAILLLDDQRSRLGRSLGKLELHKRSAIYAAFFEGATYPELADRAGVPLSTMKSWVRRGLMQLRRDLDEVT